MRLEEVALDISFALDKLEEEARRRKAEEEARKAAEALRESQRFVQRILEITPDLVYMPPQQNLWGDSGSGSRPKL